MLSANEPTRQEGDAGSVLGSQKLASAHCLEENFYYC